MAVINTGLLTRDARSEFFNQFDPIEAEAFFRRAATEIQSTKNSENYRWLGTVPQMREWGTGRVAKGLRSESYDVKNLKYEATLEVDRDELADDQTGQIMVRVRELAQRAATHKDKMIGDLLINGGAAGFNAYDGKTFFATDHVSGASGSQSNALTPAATDVSNPTTAEFKTALRDAIVGMMELKDDQAEPAVLGASGLVCVVPPAMYFTAREALNAAIIANMSNIDVGLADVVSYPWLSAATTWYLIKTDGFIRPFIFQNREPLEMKDMAEGSDEEFMREKYYFGVRARYRITFGYWQFAVRNIFTL